MNKNSTNHIAQAHDNFVRNVMADPRVARDFFEAHLPTAILAVIDLGHLSLQPRSRIDELRQEAIADLLYKTTIAGRKGYLYLLVEHQSTADKIMAFRILKYMVHIMDQHLASNEHKTLPLIYPLVIYHDKSPYPYSTDIKDLVDAPQELIEAFFLKPFHLIDLGKIEDSILKQHTWAGVMEFVLKHIFARDMLPYLHEIMILLRQLEQSNGRNFVSIVLQYIIDRGEFSDKSALINLVKTELSPEMGDNIMTLAEQFKRDGIKEGVEKVAKRSLAQGIKPAFVAKITGLSLEKIKELAKNLKTTSHHHA